MSTRCPSVAQDVPDSGRFTATQRDQRRLLAHSEGARSPEVFALAALFSFDAARLATRLDEEGVFVPLSAQDRSRWDRALIEQGVTYLALSASGSQLTRWHLEAGIACEHALAPTLEQTSWPRILELYDALLEREPGPVVALNRAVAFGEVHGPLAGRAELERIEEQARLVTYPFYWGALADFARRTGRDVEACRYYHKAIDLARSRAERVAYERRLGELLAG